VKRTLVREQGDNKEDPATCEQLQIMKAYIETFGCQMNERDSEIIAHLLGRASYSPAADIDTADLVVINTCSIRGKAEQKAMSLLGRLAIRKKKEPRLKIVVAGCVAQQEGQKIIDRVPQTDLVIGPQEIYRLAEYVEEVTRSGKSIVATGLIDNFAIPNLGHVSPAPAVSRFLTIMQGCNNFCTYCIVPYTRGRETSRPAADIVAEAEEMIDSGTTEITLLGQNVNSYGLDRGEKEAFPALLRQVAALPGLKRLRFTTSNPKDLSPALADCFKELDKLCPWFHLPVQSGSDRVLEKMNRKYKRAEYLERVAALRKACPNIAITTDIIVGFPGEEETDFLATMELIKQVRYNSAYSFKYSPRPGTVAAGFADMVEETEKSRRLTALQARQNEITLEINREYEGKIVEVLVEGCGRDPGQWRGHSPENLVVNFTADDKKVGIGDYLQVKIGRGCKNSLRGKAV